MKRIEKRHIILSLAILLVIIIGVTYAYWTAVIEGVGTQMQYTAENNLKIIFTDTEFIDSGIIEPGWKVSKTFTVKSESKSDFKYNIVINNLINTFVTEGYLQYKITSENGYNMTTYRDIPKSETAATAVLAYNINISPNDTQIYTLELVYHDSEEDQSVDIGKTFSGKLGLTVGTKEKKSIYNMLTDGTKYPTVETRSDYSTPVGGTEISDETTSGVIYKTSNASEYEEGVPIYYFAGNPSDNWVKFGKETVNGEEKDIYWRIIRTNHDKSVRLLYAGNTPDTTEGYIKSDGTNAFTTKAFNTTYNDTMYVGWKYGTSGSQASNRTNTNSSTIRDAVIGWYNDQIKPKYESYISKEAIYCNDRSAGEGYASSGNMYYSGYTKLYKKQPSYQCGMNTTGEYSNTSGSWIATGIAGRLYSDASDQDKFREGVGIMTADEIMMAGGVYNKNAPNTYYYRNSKESCTSDTDSTCSITGSVNWWTMSPYGNSIGSAFVFNVIVASPNPGCITETKVSVARAVRPVVSLNSTALVSGSGTVSDPFVLENN